MTTHNEPTTEIITSDGANFAFGEAKCVLATHLSDYTGVFASHGGEYYNPPVSRAGLAKLWRANGHHESAIGFKQNMMIKYLEQNELLSRRHARYAALDYQVFGEMNLQVFSDRFGNIKRLARLPVLNMRKRLDGRFCRTNVDQALLINNTDVINYQPGEVLQVCQADVSQDIYGVPHYVGGMQSVLLSEAATLYRRSYYLNGTHSGYILCTWDLPNEISKDLAEKIKAGKAPGNFSNYYIGGSSKPGVKADNLKDKVQVIPIGDVSQKDDYERIQKCTRIEIFGMHRIQPALAAMIPDANSSFGDIEKISRVNYENEVVPMQQIFEEFNEYLPRKHWLTFRVPEFQKD